MDRLRHSLSRAEVSQLLDLDVTVVDALVESGRLLCHYRRGEPRIPLDQLESFFRDALVRLYRAEAAEGVGGRQLAVGGEDRAALAVDDGHPEAVATEDAPDEPAAADCQPPTADRQPIPLPPPAARDEPTRPDQRMADRFVPLRQIDGIFGETRFSILQMSATGLRIKHRDTLLPGTEAKVSFALLKPARSIVVRARVVWTSIARAGEDRFSISGLRILEHQERVARAIDLLKNTNELQPERRVTPRRSTDGLLAIEEMSDEEIALVTSAVQKFAADPVEAGRWYSRARFALSDENVRRAAPQHARDREEVLGIWEYLDRQVDIPKIAGIVGWIRQAG